MIGLVQKTLLTLVEEKLGKQEANLLKEKSNIPADRIFRANDVCTDQEWQTLQKNALEKLNMSEDQFCQEFANVFFKDLDKLFPNWHVIAKNSRLFLEYQSVIVNSMGTAPLEPNEREQTQDRLVIESQSADKLTVRYTSSNKLCKLYKTVAQWAANYYGDSMQIHESSCLLKNDPCCLIHFTWTSIKSPEGAS